MGMVVWCAAPKMQLDRSQSMPFLSRPPALDGTMAGDVGFDPLGFTNYFDINNNPTTEANDVCGKRYTSCTLRFPEGDLPFGGFPGARLQM